MSEAHMKKIEDDLMTAELSRASQLSVENKALRDERDRLRSTIRTLCSSGNRLLDDLIGRSDAAESFKYHVKQAQAALTPAREGRNEIRG